MADLAFKSRQLVVETVDISVENKTSGPGRAETVDWDDIPPCHQDLFRLIIRIACQPLPLAWIARSRAGALYLLVAASLAAAASQPELQPLAGEKGTDKRLLRFVITSLRPPTPLGQSCGRHFSMSRVSELARLSEKEVRGRVPDDGNDLSFMRGQLPDGSFHRCVCWLIRPTL